MRHWTSPYKINDVWIRAQGDACHFHVTEIGGVFFLIEQWSWLSKLFKLPQASSGSVAESLEQQTRVMGLNSNFCHWLWLKKWRRTYKYLQHSNHSCHFPQKCIFWQLLLISRIIDKVVYCNNEYTLIYYPLFKPVHKTFFALLLGKTKRTKGQSFIFHQIVNEIIFGTSVETIFPAGNQESLTLPPVKLAMNIFRN